MSPPWSWVCLPGERNRDGGPGAGALGLLGASPDLGLPLSQRIPLSPSKNSLCLWASVPGLGHTASGHSARRQGQLQGASCLSAVLPGCVLKP